MAEEPSFEFRDRRRVSADGTPRENVETPEAETEGGSPEAEAGTASETAQEAAGKAAGGARETSEALPPITARDLVQLYINQLQEIAWSRMGLTPNPTSGTIERDLPDARLAIDCAADLIRHLDPLVDPATRRDLQNLLATLRLNFVQQSSKG